MNGARPLHAALAIASCLALAQCPARADFSIFDIGAVGSSTTVGQAINSSGQVVGDVVGTSTGSNYHAMYFNGASAKDLGTLGGLNSYGYGINDSGVVVGASSPTSGSNTPQHAFYYDGTMHDIGTLGGSGTFSYAYGITNAGQIVGYSGTAAGPNHAFLYTASGGMKDLGSYVSGGQSFAGAINQNGLIAGSADILATGTGTPDHAVTIDLSGGVNNPKYTDLGTLAGPAYANQTNSQALGLNNHGDVVGTSGISVSQTTTQHAFLYRNGSMVDLGTLGTGQSSAAYGINDSGTIVGYSQYVAGNTADHAFISYNGGPMIDLNTLISPSLGWTLETATGINDAGQITGYGINAQGQLHAFVLTPTTVPEPSSLALLATGVIGLGLLARRPVARR